MPLCCGKLGLDLRLGLRRCLGLGLRFGLGGGCGYVLPLAERAAEESGGAAFATEDDDVLAEGHVPVPGHETDAVR